MLVKEKSNYHLEEFQQWRSLLFGVAYRMLGSVMDAEDILQESYLQFARINPEEIRTSRALLLTIVTRQSIDYSRQARHRREEYVGDWLPEPLLTTSGEEPGGGGPELEESVTTAFLVMLESLNPVERAVFLLRDVFDFDYTEIAPIIEKTPENCRQIASRARGRLPRQERRYPEDPSEGKRLLSRFIRACRLGEVDDLVEMLAGEAILYSDGGGKITAAINPIYGASNIARFMVGVTSKAPPGVLVRNVRINHRPAFALYNKGELESVTILDFNLEGRPRIYSIRNPDKLQKLKKEIPLRFHGKILFRLMILSHRFKKFFSKKS